MSLHFQQSLRHRLEDGLKQMGLSVSSHQLDQFGMFFELLLEWNQKMNLTTITDPEKVVTHHFLDSASCALSPGYDQAVELLDVGTGAGFPGVPLKILFPDQAYTLMDSLRKRITFLHHVTGTLELEKTRLIHMRAEDGGRDPQHREIYDAVVSRAVAGLPVLLEYAIPFVKVGGRFFCQKGPQWEEEMKEGQYAMKQLSVELEESLRVRIPFTELQHQLLVFRKTAATPSQYPRKPGTPAKKPL